MTTPVIRGGLIVIREPEGGEESTMVVFAILAWHTVRRKGRERVRFALTCFSSQLNLSRHSVSMMCYGRCKMNVWRERFSVDKSIDMSCLSTSDVHAKPANI